MPGATSACTCAAGEPGTRVCDPGGAFGACMCAAPDAGEDAAAADGGADAGRTDAGRTDAGRADAGGSMDAGGPTDAGVAPDAGSVVGIVDVTGYLRRTCVVHSDGRVLCLGADHFDPESCPGRPVPTAVAGLADAVEVSTGFRHTCARRRGGEVVCWGEGGSGQLGDGRATSSASPVPVAGLADARQVAAGSHQACAIRADRTVWCWGMDALATEPAPEPVRIAGVSDAAQVAIGATHACVRLASGRVQCWGENLTGQLGNGVADDGTTIPTEVMGLDDAIDVAAGDGHTCAVRASGQVVCWGDGVFGQLGNGVERGSMLPTDALGVHDAVAVGAFTFHSCALRASGAVACWGFGEGGALGNGDLMHHATAVAVGPFAGSAVSLGGGLQHTCVSTSAGELFCWGLTRCGATGSTDLEPLPIRVPIP